MRITTGIYKGRNLAMPEGIRPTQEKVRKAVFDILGDISGLSFLELFAGSGAVGFEALSRGVSELVLVEQDCDCLKVIEKNSLLLGRPHGCFVYPQEAVKAIEELEKRKKKFDIVFLDPPYYKGKAPEESPAKKALQTIGRCDIVAPNGLVVAQHFRRDAVPRETGQYSLLRQSRYGDTVLSFYGV